MLSQMFIAQNHPKQEEKYLNVSIDKNQWTNPSVGSSSDVSYITVNTNLSSWKVSVSEGDSSYLQFDKTSGEAGTTKIKVTPAKNFTQAMNYVINIVSSDGSLSKSVTLTIKYHTLVARLVGKFDATADETYPYKGNSIQIQITTTWPSFYSEVVNTEGFGNTQEWEKYVKIEDHQPSSDLIKVTMLQSWYGVYNESEDGVATIQMTIWGRDETGNEVGYNFDFDIKGISTMNLHFKFTEGVTSYLNAYCSDPYHTRPALLQNLGRYWIEGIFHTEIDPDALGSHDMPHIHIFDEYGVDCTSGYNEPTYGTSDGKREISILAQYGSWEDNSYGQKGLKFIFRTTQDALAPNQGAYIRSMVFDYDPNTQKVSSVNSYNGSIGNSYGDRVYVVGYERDDEINPTGTGSVAMAWFNLVDSSVTMLSRYYETRDVGGYTNFGKVVSVSIPSEGYRLYLITEWNGDTTTKNGVTVPNHFTGYLAKLASPSNAFTANNFQWVTDYAE